MEGTGIGLALGRRPGFDVGEKAAGLKEDSGVRSLRRSRSTKPLAVSTGDSFARLNDAALDWLAMQGRGSLIVSPTMRIEWANPAARSLLERDRAVSTHAGHLVFSREGRRFGAFLRETSSAVTTLVVPFLDTPGHLLFRAWRILSRSGPLYGLELVADHSDHRAHYADLDIVFQLTAREHGIVVQLLNGHSVTEIAAERGVSVDTVRTQIRRIYVKIDVTSREQLFSRLQPFRIL